MAKLRLDKITLAMVLASSLTFLLAAMPCCDPKEKIAATHYYVDIDHQNARDDEKHGSINKPWRTLEYAFQQLRPGDTLLVRGGTYENAAIILTEQNSGRDGSPITVQAYPNETVVLRNGKPIFFYGAKWWIIDGLHFEQPQGTYIRLGQHEELGYERTVAAEHIVIRNCEFGNGKYPALPIFYGSEILIENNYFHHIRPGRPFSEEGREISAVVIRYIGDNIVIRNNRFEDIGSDGVHLGSHAYIPGSDIGTVKITANEFWVNRPYSGILGNVGENGIDVKKCRGPILISGNKIHGFRPTTPQQDASGANGDGLIVHDNAQNVIIEGNLFYDNTAHLNIAKGAGEGPRDIIVRNNIFSRSIASDNPGYTVEGSALQVRSADDVQVHHNTFYDNDWFLLSNHVSRCVFKNNIVIGGEAKVQEHNSEWEADYNAWSQITGSVPTALQGEHDVVAEDLALDQDFRPLPNSPVVGAGQNVGVTNDLAGNPRGAPPDLGALEHISN